MTTEKTYKREVAVFMLTWLAGMTIWGIYEPQAAQAAEFFALPIFTFAGAAFALDAAFKQGGASLVRK